MSGVGALIQGANSEIWGRVVADEGKTWKLEGGRVAKKETEGTKWHWVSEEKTDSSASGIGAQIKAANGEIWGLVVADGGKVWQLEGGRVAKKETEGTKWFWMSGAQAQVADPSQELTLEVQLMSGSVVSLSILAGTTVGEIAGQLKEQQVLAWVPQLLVGGRLLDHSASAGSAGGLLWDAVVVKPTFDFSRWRDHLLQWREITVPLFTPYHGPSAVPVLFGEDSLVLSPPPPRGGTEAPRLTGIDEFWIVGANEKMGDYDPRPTPQAPYSGICRLPLPLAAGTKLRYHNFDGSVLVAVLDDPEPGDKRIDPQDNQAYTFDELSAYYKGQYSKKQMSNYWEQTCWPVEKVSMHKFRLCCAHMDIGKARWEPEGKVQHVSFDLSSWNAGENFMLEHNIKCYKAPASGFHAEHLAGKSPDMQSGLRIRNNNDSNETKEKVDVVIRELYDGKLGVFLDKTEGRATVVNFGVDGARSFWNVGDEIVAINGDPLEQAADFNRLYGAAKTTLPVTFTVMRSTAPCVVAEFHANHPELALDAELLLLSGENAGEDAFYDDMRLFDWHTGELVKTIPLEFSMRYIEPEWPSFFLVGSSQTFMTACSAEAGNNSENCLVAFCTPL